jgi:Holliday junction DNA helicase RuvA
MIASLTGVVEQSTPGEVIVNVGGVGYLVSVPLSTFARLPAEGKEARLLVVTILREDEIRLFGFSTEAEKWFFQLLQNVTGVGPKLALKILSGMEPNRLRDAISLGDLALLTSVSGVGKKLAERLVVELRDKVGAIEGLGLPAASAAGTADSEAADALTALGYPPKVARQAVEAAVREGASGVETIIREALKRLAQKR